MTIDNAIKHMEQARYDYCEYWEETRNDTTIAFDVAISSMRKYQKIQEIVARWKVDTWTDGVSYDCMAQISEVIDGA